MQSTWKILASITIKHWDAGGITSCKRNGTCHLFLHISAIILLIWIMHLLWSSHKRQLACLSMLNARASTRGTFIASIAFTCRPQEVVSQFSNRFFNLRFQPVFWVSWSNGSFQSFYRMQNWFPRCALRVQIFRGINDCVNMTIQGFLIKLACNGMPY